MSVLFATVNGYLVVFVAINRKSAASSSVVEFAAGGSLKNAYYNWKLVMI